MKAETTANNNWP